MPWFGSCIVLHSTVVLVLSIAWACRVWFHIYVLALHHVRVDSGLYCNILDLFFQKTHHQRCSPHSIALLSALTLDCLDFFENLTFWKVRLRTSVLNWCVELNERRIEGTKEEFLVVQCRSVRCFNEVIWGNNSLRRTKDIGIIATPSRALDCNSDRFRCSAWCHLMPFLRVTLWRIPSAHG